MSAPGVYDFNKQHNNRVFVTIGVAVVLSVLVGYLVAYTGS
jgi:hypothetical protein